MTTMTLEQVRDWHRDIFKSTNDPNHKAAADAIDAHLARQSEGVSESHGWRLGDVDVAPGGDMWTAGIDVPVDRRYSGDGVHHSAIECHAATKESAEALREQVMRAALTAVWHNQPAQEKAETVAIGRIDESESGMFVEFYPDRDLPLGAEVYTAPPAERVMVPDALAELSATATPGAWRSMREGNQFIDTRYMPTMKCVGASRIDGPKRPWNPHALIAFGFKPEEYEKVRMTDADADFVCALVNWFRSLTAAPEADH